MKSLSGLKDVDREILLKMSDEELLKNCSLNKYYSEEVCNDNFFHKVMLTRYPSLVKHKKGNMNWKQFYLYSLYYISKIEELGYNYFDFKDASPEVVYQLMTTKNVLTIYRLLGTLQYPEAYTPLLDFLEKTRINEVPFINIHSNNIHNSMIVAINRDNFNLFKYLLSHYYPIIQDNRETNRNWNRIMDQYKGDNDNFRALLQSLKKY